MGYEFDMERAAQIVVDSIEELSGLICKDIGIHFLWKEVVFNQIFQNKQLKLAYNQIYCTFNLIKNKSNFPIIGLVDAYPKTNLMDDSFPISFCLRLIIFIHEPSLKFRKIFFHNRLSQFSPRSLRIIPVFLIHKGGEITQLILVDLLLNI